MEAHDRRRGELHKLRDSDPARLISMYRQVAALNDDRPLPLGVTYVGIVEAILANEVAAEAKSHESC